MQDARFVRMVEAARGHSDIPSALMRAGFSAAEFLDHLPDIISALQQESQCGFRAASAA